MSLTFADFHRSLNALAPDLELSHGHADVRIPVGKSDVRIFYEPLEGATLGGLLALPRARVTLFLEGLDANERDIFLTRFDRAFQRGGG